MVSATNKRGFGSKLKISKRRKGFEVREMEMLNEMISDLSLLVH